MRTLICIPVFNEAETVAGVLQGLHSISDSDILVVDDGSADGSSAAVAKCGLPVQLIRHKRNLGYGFALREGFRRALQHRYEALVTFDADGQHVPEEVTYLLAALSCADVVTGSRFHAQSPAIGHPPAWRLQANQFLTEMVRRHTGYSITDSACGFRAYSAMALSRLRITEPGYRMPYQLWGQMAHGSLAVSEIPVTRIYTEESIAPPDPQALARMILLCEHLLLREMRGESRLVSLVRAIKGLLP